MPTARRATSARKTAAKPAAAKATPAATKGMATARALDFTNVKEGSNFNPKRKKAGDYLAKIVSVTDEESKQGNAMWVFGITLSTDSRAVYPYYCILDEASLWKIRNLVMATGKDVPKRKIKLDPNKLVGQEIGIALDDDEYDGKPKSVIVATFPTDELGDVESPDDDDEDVEDDVDDDDIDDDDVSDDDMEEMELDEL